MKICAIVVTYNRKELLEKQIIEVLRNQKLKIDAYYVIDNCSTDNTDKLIEKYEETVVKYRRTKSNCGGAGGFSYGLQCAFEDKYDWYILMDDDGRPMDEDCFENMKKQIVKKRYNSQNAYFPVVFDGYKYTRNEIYEMLQEQGITARKYFYPLTNSFECYRNYPTAGTEKTPVAQHLALRVLTLPLYADLALKDVDRICNFVLS